MNPRLAEAMQPTRYNKPTPQVPSTATGKAFEKPIDPKPEPAGPPVERQDWRRPESKPARAPSRPVRETSEEDFEDQFTDADLMDPSEKGPTRHRHEFQNSPDPFPLQYRQGDPDQDFDVSGSHGQ